MNKVNLNTLLIYALPIMVGGVMLNIFNVYVLLLFLLIYLITIEKIEIAISFAIILPPLLGNLFQVFNIPFPGAFFSIIFASILSFRYFIYLKTWNLGQIVKYITPIVLTCIMFYLFTGDTDNSNSKITGLLITLCYTPFLIFITRSDKVSMDRLAPVFIIYALLMIRIAYDFYGYASPLGLFDFTSFRLGGYANVRDDVTHVNYQNVGIAALMSSSYWLSTRTKISNLLDWIIILSGARQAMLGFIIIIGFWLLCRNGKFSFKGAVYFTLFLVASIFFLQSLNVEFIAEMFNDSNNIDRDYTYPLFVIANNYLTGIGFGNYYDPVYDLYFAHNLFLEVLSEMGIIGFILLFFPLLRFSFSNHHDFSQRFKNGALSLLIFLPYFIRSMISDDLSRNIIVFITFIIFFYKNNKVKHLNYL
jgi:hypothetical protein